MGNTHIYSGLSMAIVKSKLTSKYQATIPVVADGRSLPFEIKAPNKDTQKAMDDFDNQKAVSFDSVDALMEDINTVD